MAKIQKLDAQLANMIAAGEVVERPVGVVKELVENCIDAKAKHIQIHIQQGGLQEINIIDDGIGMSPQDACLAFERHATSKIKDVNDLWNITSMGFRGEALPSIASVSHVVLNTNDGQDSTQVEIAYGKHIHAKSTACNQGTQIVVSNLFQKTPARLKHLKSINYEFSLISDVIQKFAFARSDISFQLYHDDKLVFSSNGRNNIQEVIMNVYGREVAKQAIRVDIKDSDYAIHGYTIQPSVNRASKYYMLLFINQRMVRSYRLQKMILDAYREYLPNDRYPISVIHIDMDAKLVDVNVHPSKWEVRLSKEKQLEELLYKAIAQALQTKIQTVQVQKKQPEVKVEPMRLDITYEPENIATPLVKEVQKEFAIHVEPLKSVVEKEVYDIEEEQEETLVIEDVQPLVIEKEVRVEAQNPSLPYMKAIGQIKESYIIAQGDHGMYIIDQHAAQERYRYECIQKQILEGVLDTQDLLIPISIDSTLSMVNRVEELNDLFAQIGIQLDVFGDKSFVLRSIPLWMVQCDEQKVVLDLLEQYQKDESMNVMKLRKHTLASMACHSSIRFHRALSLEEMQGVIEDLKRCVQPFHCPHGRPTFIEFTLKELEKQFLRTG